VSSIHSATKSGAIARIGWSASLSNRSSRTRARLTAGLT